MRGQADACGVVRGQAAACVVVRGGWVGAKQPHVLPFTLPQGGFGACGIEPDGDQVP